MICATAISVRAMPIAGTLSKDYVHFRFIDNINPQTSTTTVNVPVHNVIDNLPGPWQPHIPGRCELASDRQQPRPLMRIPLTAPAPTSRCWSAAPSPDRFRPVNLRLSRVGSGFSNNYLIAYANSERNCPSSLDNVYNYKANVRLEPPVTSMPTAAAILRQYRANEFEWFLQDSWRPLPNLTLTFGLRHTMLQTPYETNGQQMSPSSGYRWLVQAARNRGTARSGPYEPLISFRSKRPRRRAARLLADAKLNLAPRFSLAYSPDNKTSIRAGFGMFYDHFGQGIVNSFSDTGSFGVSTGLTNPAGVYDWSTSPRFTGVNNLPIIESDPPPPTSTTFPYGPCRMPPSSSPGVSATKLKLRIRNRSTFSVQRLCPADSRWKQPMLDASGRHLMQQLDLAEPLDFVDPRGAWTGITRSPCFR